MDLCSYIIAKVSPFPHIHIAEGMGTSGRKSVMQHVNTSHTADLVQQNQMKRTRQTEGHHVKIPESPTKSPAKKLIKQTPESG